MFSKTRLMVIYRHPGITYNTQCSRIIVSYSNSLVGKSLKFLGLRYDNHMNLDSSLVWQIKQSVGCNFDDEEQIKFVGWELNKNQKPQPRMVSMRESMDPQL